VTRQQKTPQQRAEETLAVAERKRNRLVDQALRLHKQVKALDANSRRPSAAWTTPRRTPPCRRGRRLQRTKSTTTAPSTTSNQSGDTA
jgi:hypothetical protein